MSTPVPRRSFLAASAALGAAAAAGKVRASSPSENLVIGVMGVNGRGSSLAETFGRVGAEIAFICDVDARAAAKCASAVAERQQHAPETVGDYRRVLDSETVDALVIAAPNHWHAPAGIAACAAGKHVYVEKPCCQNPAEGEWFVAAARKHDRVVQHGTQRRSWPGMQELMARLHDGVIGRVLSARSWYNNRRDSIGRGHAMAAPEALDYELWQGPAPRVPYRSNLIHYNWHWFWRWGNGELGNNGVHVLDLCRWGLDVDYPVRAVSAGGRYRFDDDQQTPDTHLVSFEYADGRMISWEGRSCSPYGFENSQFGATFYGTEGTIVIGDEAWKQLDMHNREVASGSVGPAGDTGHVKNFVAAVKAGEHGPADIEVAHKTALLCHLGNISHRTGRALVTDAANGHIIGDDEAAALWRREYAPGFEPVV